MSKRLIAPSILSADFGNLQKEIEMINKSQADFVHVDVMDGVFVPNISIGLPVVRSIKKHSQKPLDVHLMIVEPDKYLEDFKTAGAGYLTVHYEACLHLNRTVNQIKKLGMKAGVCINPHTPVFFLENIINDANVILLMSVNPGFGGQKFIENTYQKIESLKELILKKGSQCLIEVDGGIDLTNAEKVFSKGADILVAGNTVFSSDDPAGTISLLKG